jgi:hypothetical protein
MRSALILTRHSTLIHRGVEDVYRFIAVDFFLNYRKWSPEVSELKQIAAGAMRVGVTGSQVRYDHGFRSEATFRVTRMTPMQELRFASLTGPEFDVGYRFEPVAADTRVTFDFRLRLPLYALPLRKRVENAVEQGGRHVVSNLRALLDSAG